MLLTRAVLDGIVNQNIDLVFRRWQKPSVKTSGRLRTVVGVLAITAVDKIEVADITDEHARRAGFADATTLTADLFRERPNTSRGARSDGPRDLYRVEVRFAGADERIDLRADDQLTENEIRALVEKLDGIDKRSPNGAWTTRVLDLIETWPGRRAPELAELEGRETIPFKTDVRKLKALGLTESLPVGYRLSPRGAKIREAINLRESAS
jgi:hypothetical protein